MKGSEIKSCFRSCPNGWEEVDNACFLWPDVAKSWANAEKYCNDENSHLASVSNQETHDYIRSRVRTTDSTTFFWIGGTDKDQEGHWTWRDGSTWNFSQWSTQPVIQPDNYGGNEDCLQIYHENTEEGWNDYVCEKKIKFVCSQRICEDESKYENASPVLAIALLSGSILIIILIALAYMYM